jgi:hypothetical protein
MSSIEFEESSNARRCLRPAAWAAATVVAALAGSLGALPARAEVGEQTLGSNGNAAPESTSVYYQYPGRPRVWLSPHGNVVRFEGPAGYDHIGVGTVIEGYVLCYNGRRAWDLAFSETGFGPSTPRCSGNTCTVTRNTSDGQFRLQQVITKDSVNRALTIEMSLTKIGFGSAFDVVLRRHADFDVDAGGSLGSGNFTSWFGASERESVWAWNPANYTANEGHMVHLRQLDRRPFTVPYSAKVVSSIGDTSCSPGNVAANGPVEGDFAGTIQYDVGFMGQGSTFVGRVQYQRD